MSATAVVVRGEAPASPSIPAGRGVRAYRVSAGYNGARSDIRSLKSWNPAGGSPDADILVDLPPLRARSRDLVRNNPIAGGAISTLASYTVGTGLAVQPQVDREYLGLTEEEAAAWQRKAERAFWACADQLDIERTLSFRGLQRVVFEGTLESGDIFSLRRYKPRPGDIIGTKLQLIEGDRVCNPRDRFDSATLAGGVERDPDGAPIAYHVLSQHPGDLYLQGRLTAREWKRVPAFDAEGQRLTLHHFRKRRPGQTRGVTIFAPIIEAILQLGRYTNAEVEAAVINAFFTVFVTGAGDDVTASLQTVEPEVEGVHPDSELELGSGTIADLAPGENLAFADPKRPNVNFGAFAEAVLKQIAVGIELPFEVLMKHFNASYSASRAALLDAWKTFMNWRVWLVETFCQPVYGMVITELVARGVLEAPGFWDDPFARLAWLGAEWVGDSMGQIDPLKEATAMTVRLEAGVTTLQEETMAFSGKDWSQNTEQRGREKAKREELGLEEPVSNPDLVNALVKDEPSDGGGK